MPPRPLFRFMLPFAAIALLAGNGPVAIKSRGMKSEAYQLAANQTTKILSQKTDDRLIAEITLDKSGQSIIAIKASRDDRRLLVPQSAFAAMKGATTAWLEKRGALSTLVVTGDHLGKVWKVALEFHPKQLWKRRLTIEGVRRDEFIFYDRNDMMPSNSEHRSRLTR
jgi:hypothetical protein